MRISLNWLKDYVKIDLSPGELAHHLTMAGLEVEGIDPLGQSIKGVIAARVISFERHPRADRLFICHMETGRGVVPVVCGAPNLTEGIMVPMALPGAELPSGMVVKEGRFRGEMSKGMLLAEDELGLTEDHAGIMILDKGLEPGTELSEVMSMEDVALDISLTPNRADCASVIGVAREVAAITGQDVMLPEIEYMENGPPITDLANVTIDDTGGCPRYAAGMVQGVDLKPSPFWMRYRLHVSGVRAINNVVDITNYVLLEMGQPLHAFDYDRLKGHRIIVSRARDGDTFSTLDGQTHTLNREHLMICDGERPVALAGIMGGLNSEIFAGSRNVLIESAYFDPVTIRRGSKSIGLSTEASYRFERGIDIGAVEKSLRRALMLISQLTGGVVNRGVIDVYPEPFHPSPIGLRIGKTNDFLGTSLLKENVVSYMKSLGMGVRDLGDDAVEVIPPTYRRDITREVDLMEEVARLEGYDKIPVTYPVVLPSEDIEAPAILLRDQAGEILAGLGFSEIITYSFISPDSADRLGAGKESPIRSFVTLQNPLTTEQSVMRTSLVPGLLETVKENIYHGETDLKMFEWGNIFIARDPDSLPLERLFLSAIMTGRYHRDGLHSEARQVDFYDMKGAVEVLLRSLGLSRTEFKRHTPEPWYHPGFSCRIYESGSCIGILGRVHSDVMERFDVKAGEAYLSEIDVEALMEKRREQPVQFMPYSRFPAVLRDLSIIVDKRTESARIRDIIEKEGGELVESVKIFDLYEGEKIEPRKKAVSFRICYRSRQSTLDGKQVNRLHEKVINRIMRETGGKLREG